MQHHLSWKLIGLLLLLLTLQGLLLSGLLRPGWAAVGTTALALTMAAVGVRFERRLRARFESLRANMLRFRRGDLPARPMEGDDPVAAADRFLRETAVSLEEASRRERLVLEGMLDLMATLDAKGRILEVQGAPWRGREGGSDHLRGRAFESLVAAEDAESVRRALEGTRAAGRTTHFEFRLREGWGPAPTFLAAASWDPGRGRVHLVAQDISGRRRMEEELRSSAAVLAAVLRLQHRVATEELSPDAVMREVAELVVRLTSAEGSHLLLAEEDEDLVVAAACGTGSGGEGDRFNLGGTLVGAAYRTGEIRVIDDADADPQVSGGRLRVLGVRSAVVVPFYRAGRVEGVLSALHPEPGVFTPQDVNTLRLMGTLVGAALGQSAERRAEQALLGEQTRALAERERLVEELREALARVKTLKGLIPICSSCKKIRDDQGFWTQLETYLKERADADLSHGICPDCARRLYPEFVDAVPSISAGPEREGEPPEGAG